jgi:hypothetical protein
MMNEYFATPAVNQAFEQALIALAMGLLGVSRHTSAFPGPVHAFRGR